MYFGGDEVLLGVWNLFFVCVRLLEKIKFDYLDWKVFFICCVIEIVEKYGINLGFWEDGLMDYIYNFIMWKKLGIDVFYGYVWGNIMNFGYRLVNDGYKVFL